MPLAELKLFRLALMLLLWPILIVGFLGVVFVLIVSFIRLALADHDSAAEPVPTNA